MPNKFGRQKKASEFLRGKLNYISVKMRYECVALLDIASITVTLELVLIFYVPIEKHIVCDFGVADRRMPIAWVFYKSDFFVEPATCCGSVEQHCED